MTTKLTLTLKKEVIERAKLYAADKGRSLSEMVENYFKYLTETRLEDTEEKVAGRVSKLRGVIKTGDDFDYKRVLDEERSKKHGL